MPSEEDFFNLNHLIDCFNACLKEKEDVQIQPFLDAFTELNRFCTLMGGMLFSAVSTEITSKSMILSDFLCRDPINYSSLNKMIEYETREGLLKNGICGCRTLLRLIWGLDFVRTFFDKASRLKPTESTCTAGREAYDYSLANHHGWLIRQGAYICLWSLPSKADLMRRLFGDQVEEAQVALPQTITASNMVYDQMHVIYCNNNLLGLP